MLLHSNTGWGIDECPRCACHRLDVSYTYLRQGQRIRVRVCCNCGKRIKTTESVACVLSDAPKHVVPAK